MLIRDGVGVGGTGNWKEKKVLHHNPENKYTYSHTHTRKYM